MIEREINFRIPEGRNSASVRDAVALAGFRLQLASTAAHEDRYIDTESWTLYRAGIALRLRGDGRRVQLEAKSIRSTDETMLAPTEWAQVAPAGDPPWKTLEPGPVAALLHPMAGLHVLERLQVRARMKYDRALNGAKLAAALHAVGERFPECHERAFAMNHADRLLDVAHKTFGRQFARLLWNEPGTRLGVDPTFVHDMRVACRRLRTALDVLVEGFPLGAGERFAPVLRWVGRALGRVRDLDVALEGACGMEFEATTPERLALQVFTQSLSLQRAERRVRLAERLDSERFTEFTADSEAWIEAGPPQGSSAPNGVRPAYAVGQMIVATWVSAMRQAYTKAHESMTTGALHALRITAKRARYAIEYFAELDGLGASRRAKRIATLQDFLGDHRDAENLLLRMKKYARTVPRKDRELVMGAGSILGHLERAARIRRGDLREAWEKAVSE